MLPKQLEAFNESNKKSQEAHEKKNEELSKALKELTATVNELKLEKQKNSDNNSITKQTFSREQNYRQGDFNSFRNPQNFRQAGFGPSPGYPQNFQNLGAPRNFQMQQNRPVLFCSECGKFGHMKRNCRFIECHGCGQKGHIQRFCQKNNNYGQNNNRDNRNFPPFSRGSGNGYSG